MSTLRKRAKTKTEETEIVAIITVTVKETRTPRHRLLLRNSRTPKSKKAVKTNKKSKKTSIRLQTVRNPRNRETVKNAAPVTVEEMEAKAIAALRISTARA